MICGCCVGDGDDGSCCDCYTGNCDNKHDSGDDLYDEIISSCTSSNYHNYAIPVLIQV